jgi:hypothetical protein
MAALLTFQKFNDPDLAQAIAERLAKAGIEYAIQNEHPHLDPLIIGNTPEPLIHLQIPSTDFVRAHALLEAYYEEQLQDIDPGYYLFSFTDEELLEILTRPDEWGHFDYVLARKLLIERGHDITPEFTERLKAHRLEELANFEDAELSKPGQTLAMRTMTYAISDRKKVLPDGREVSAYSPAARKRGRFLLIIGVIAMVLYLLRMLFR